MYRLKTRYLNSFQPSYFDFYAERLGDGAAIDRDSELMEFTLGEAYKVVESDDLVGLF